jgi:hypothetical protein
MASTPPSPLGRASPATKREARIHSLTRSRASRHFHSQVRRATLFKRVRWNGVGEEFDFKKAIPMKVDSFVRHPANEVHWDGAGDEVVVVRIIGEGSVETTAVSATNAPRDSWPNPK